MKKNDQDLEKTYFYVFVQKEVSEHGQKGVLEQNPRRNLKQAAKAELKTEISADTNLLDYRVTQAFERFRNAFADEAVVIINPERFHDYRKLFGIKKLPAFGVYKKDLSEKVGRSEPERLPGPLEFWNWKKRGEILAARDFYPMVERNTLERFEDVESIFNFIRDLHIANIDSSLRGVVAAIDRTTTQIAGKKAGELYKMGKDFIK